VRGLKAAATWRVTRRVLVYSSGSYDPRLEVLVGSASPFRPRHHHHRRRGLRGGNRLAMMVTILQSTNQVERSRDASGHCRLLLES